MKHLSSLVGFLCLVALVMPGCAPAPEPEPSGGPGPQFDREAEEAAVRKVMEQVGEALNEHDVEAFVALLAEDVEDWEAHLKGRAAFEEWWSGFFARQKGFQWNVPEEIGVAFLTPEVAVSRFYGERRGLVDEDGHPLPPTKSLCATLYVKKDGKWLEVAFFERPVEE